MINNIASLDLRPQMTVAKAMPSLHSISMPPILAFKTPVQKEKATIRVKKIKRGDNLIIPGEIDDDYVDIVEEEIDSPPQKSGTNSGGNFFSSPMLFTPPPIKRTLKYLKNCYIIDYIQAPTIRCGMGTNAVKQLAEKAFFDKKADGRIVTFSAPLVKDASPAIFFYKLGFRFIDPQANENIEKCIKDNIPDIPAQIGMMYLPKTHLHKLLRYGELF